MEYHIEVDSEWDGVDSVVRYLTTHWSGIVIESAEAVYSRRWVVRVRHVPITIIHDSQLGNYFVREDGNRDLSLLEEIALDLIKRLS